MRHHWYDAFGLRIRSEVALPAPESGPVASPDLAIQLAPVDAPAEPLPGSRGVCYADEHEVCCRWPDVGAFLMRRGDQILIDPLPTATPELIATWIQGSALAIALHQRGFLVLHASAVCIADGAAAFVGEVGWGKSTMAAFMDRRGHPLLADDIVAIRFDGDAPQVLPAFATIKLLPPALRYLGESPEGLPHVHGDPEKRIRRSGCEMPRSPTPLRALYVLGEGPACSVDAMLPSATIVELLRHAYVARLTEFLRRTGTDRAHFAACAKIANSVRAATLRRPRRLDLLPALAQLVEQDLCQPA